MIIYMQLIFVTFFLQHILTVFVAIISDQLLSSPGAHSEYLYNCRKIVKVPIQIAFDYMFTYDRVTESYIFVNI